MLTYSNGSVDVLREEDTLELDHTEVDELLGIIQEALKGLLLDCVVFLGAHLRGQAATKCNLACHLQRGRGC